MASTRPRQSARLRTSSGRNGQSEACSLEILIADTTTSISVAPTMLENIVVPSYTPRQVVKQVLIPGSSNSLNPTYSPSDTTLSSAGTRSRDDSMDYETPGTTPALSVRGTSTHKRKRSVTVRRSSRTVHSEDVEEEDADLLFARQLQEQEYGVDVQVSKKTKRNFKPTIKDSEDSASDSELSDLESLQSSSDEEPLARKSTRQAQKKVVTLTSGSRSRPSAFRVDSVLDKKSWHDDITKDGQEQDEAENSEDEFVLDSTDDGDALSEAHSESAVEEANDKKQSKAPARRHRHKGRRAGRFGNMSRAQIAEERRAIANHIREHGPVGRRERERIKLERAHPNIKTMWKDLESTPIIEPMQAPQPASINRQLKSFQLQGLYWMMQQEKSQYRGGLLGDEMGMGKTIQAVSLIMSDYPQKQPTLVVVPPVALMQWSTEIKEYTDGKLNVLVYHGQNAKVKNMTVAQLKKYDVIMVSYNSLESLHRKQTKGWTRDDSIIKEASPIHAIHFHRLVLDEAHSIKSRTTGVAKACFALRGTYKWCLSGTPVQNRIGEFFSLLRFLEVRPFADYFCKRCPCSLLHWAFDDDHVCLECKHSSIEHVSVFNQELLNPLTMSEDPAERSAAMDKLHMITSRIMLRRLKRDHVSSMELPPKEVIVHNEFFGEIERDFSSSIMTNTTRQFDTYVARGVMLNNYANIFGLIMQMRQVANHPDLLLKKSAAEGQNALVCNICDEVAEEAIRSQCKHDFCRLCVRHYLQSVEADEGDPDCPRCHIPLAIDLDQPEIEQDEEAVKKSSIINRIRMGDWTSSTKIEMLIYDLWKLRSKKQTLKSIVFSQFTSMLQLIEWRLRRAGFNTVMLDGSMTPIQRQRSIEYFMTNTDVEVFLVSLKAGGVALNLTEASRVFIVDPWWNPAAEWQSADRCHRIGQKRPCVITRLCIEDSVESRMVMLQEKKANMINGTINKDKTSMEKLTPEDMQFLFRGS